MAKFRFNDDSLRKVKANFEAATKKKQDQLAKALASWSLDLVAEIGKEITRIGAVDQGILLGATHADPVQRLGTTLKVSVLNEVEYASVIEFGRQAGSKYPPIAPLVGWAKRHGIISLLPDNADIHGEYAKQWETAGFIARELSVHAGGGGKNAKSTPLDPIVYELLILRLIQKKIAEVGTAGRHPFSIAFDNKARTFAQDIAKYVALMN